MLSETLLGAGWRSVAGPLGVIVFLRVLGVPRGIALVRFSLEDLARSTTWDCQITGIILSGSLRGRVMSKQDACL